MDFSSPVALTASLLLLVTGGMLALAVKEPDVCAAVCRGASPLTGWLFCIAAGAALGTSYTDHFVGAHQAQFIGDSCARDKAIREATLGVFQLPLLALGFMALVCLFKIFLEVGFIPLVQQHKSAANKAD